MYVEVLRNMPLLTLLMLVVFGLPDIGIRFSLFTSAAICMAVFAAAFVCEAVRGGINTVPGRAGRGGAVARASPSPSRCGT